MPPQSTTTAAEAVVAEPRPETDVDAGGSAEPEDRPLAERIARKVLRVENAAPRALMPMKGSLVISAIRCVITYAILPAMAPVIAGIGALATPLSLTMSALAVVLAIVSLRRVWLADWSGRWGYTAFAIVVVVLLGITMVFDVQTLLA